MAAFHFLFFSGWRQKVHRKNSCLRCVSIFRNRSSITIIQAHFAEWTQKVSVQSLRIEQYSNNLGTKTCLIYWNNDCEECIWVIKYVRSPTCDLLYQFMNLLCSFNFRYSQSLYASSTEFAIEVPESLLGPSALLCVVNIFHVEWNCRLPLRYLTLKRHIMEHIEQIVVFLWRTVPNSVLDLKPNFWGLRIFHWEVKNENNLELTKIYGEIR